MASTGTVIWKDHKCDFYIVKSDRSYILFEWMSGPKPQEGDVISGKMEGFGVRKVTNQTSDGQGMVYSEGQTNSRAHVARKIPHFCRRKKDQKRRP